MKKRFLSLISLALVFCLCACLAGIPAQAAGEESVEIAIGSTDGKFIGHFDPTGGFSNDYGSGGLYLVYERVFYTDPDTREFTSNILSDYYMTEDNVAVLTVKDGVTFSRSGNQLLASDLLYSFRRSTIPAQAAGNWEKYTDLDAAYVSDDNKTLYVPFKMECGPWQTIIGAWVLEEAWIQENGGDDFDFFDPLLANGLGAYVPTELVVGTSATFERVKDWWGNEEYGGTDFCYADKITNYMYSDETTMMVNFENGVLDIVLRISANSMEYVMNNPSVGTAQEISSNTVATIVMDYDVDGNPIFENENLRKAICYGTPAEALGELAYGVLYHEPVSYLATTTPFVVEGYTYEYDPELAQSYMDESGLSDVHLKWVSNSGSAATTIAEAFQAYMSMLGITVDLEVYDILTCIQTWSEPGGTDFKMACEQNACVSGDPYDQVVYYSNTYNLHCSNRQWEDYNALIEGATYSFDQDVRADYYAQWQEYLYGTYSVIPVCEWSLGLAYGENVAGTRLVDVSTPDLRFISFS